MGGRGVSGVLACFLMLAAPAAPATAETEMWQWPTAPPHEVVLGFEPPAHRYAAGHRGIDLSIPPNAPVRAVDDGTVRFAGSVAGRGTVSVLHGNGLISTYEPVTATVAQGDRINAGTQLGTLTPGATGTGHCGADPCLHLGARRGQDYLDPLLFLAGPGPSVLLPWEEPYAPVENHRATITSHRVPAAPRSPAGAPMIGPGGTVTGAPRPVLR